ncbi:MAG: phosphotransacetylase family protein [Candidatus Bathyarchaeia archaeon]
MAYPIIICGTEFSGKTAICLGLFQKFQEIGLRVGYFKPIGFGLRTVEGRLIDPDAVLVKEVMSLEEPLEVITPIVLGRWYLELLSSEPQRLIEKIVGAYKDLSKGKDLVIIEGPPKPEILTCLRCDIPRLSGELGAKVVLVVKGSGDEIVEETILYKKFIEGSGGDLMGVIVNFVPRQVIERVKGILLPALERCGVESLGVVPDRKELSLPSVEDVVRELDAEVLAGREDLDRLVEGYLVGAMTPESALNWLRRGAGSALVTGGDRTDLILTALEADMSVVVLTGNLYPAVSVLTRAEEKGIPIMLVPQDTYTTVRLLEGVSGRITSSPSSLKKIRLTRDIVGEYVDWKRIVDDYVKWKEGERPRGPGQ